MLPCSLPALAPCSSLQQGIRAAHSIYFPCSTHSRFTQQSVTVFWVLFSLCFLQIHYIQSAFLTATEYQVNIFMEVFILTPRHSSSPATARSEPGTAYRCEGHFSSCASLGLQGCWILSAVLPGSHSVPDVLCKSLCLTHSHHPGQARSTTHLWCGVLSLLSQTIYEDTEQHLSHMKFNSTEKTYSIPFNLSFTQLSIIPKQVNSLKACAEGL